MVYSVHLLIYQKKCKLIGYVVACGLQYGQGENLFHFFFKVNVHMIEHHSVQMYSADLHCRSGEMNVF